MGSIRTNYKSMDAIKCIQTRRSVRKFSNAPVERKVIEEIVELASWTPSWKNTQTTRYFAVTDAALKCRVAEECVMGFTPNANLILSAPMLIVQGVIHGRAGFQRDGSFSTSKEDRWEIFDAGAAAQTFCLAAWEKGLGTVIMGIFDQEKLAETVQLPEDMVVGSLIAIGYPDQAPPAPPRKPVEELLLWL